MSGAGLAPWPHERRGSRALATRRPEVAEAAAVERRQRLGRDLRVRRHRSGFAAGEAAVDRAVEIRVLVLAGGLAVDVCEDHVDLAIPVGVGLERDLLAVLVDLALIDAALALRVDQDLGDRPVRNDRARVERAVAVGVDALRGDLAG